MAEDWDSQFLGEEMLLGILAMPPAMPSGLIAVLVVATPLSRCKRFFPFLLKIADFPHLLSGDFER